MARARGTARRRLGVALAQRAWQGLSLGLALYAENVAAQARAGKFSAGAASPQARPAPQPLGRAAEAPVAPGLWPLLQRVFTRIGDDRIMAEAASVTYYTLLAIFPAMATLISMYGLFADPATIGKNLDALDGIVPGGGMQILSDQMHSLIAAPNRALGLGAITGLLISIWSATSGVKSLFDALNVVYRVHETRSFVHRTWLSVAFTLGALAFIMLAVTAIVVVPAVLSYVGFASAGAWIVSVGRWPLLLVAFALFLAMTYRYGPSHPGTHWRPLSLGSTTATITWALASALFSWYVANFGSYNKTYGSLGAAVGFMTWIWISTIIVLAGAELDVERGRQAGAPRG
jgi:membrane protein